MTLSKCDYTAERYSVLSQVSQLVGIVWLNAQWACGARAEPAYDWDYKVRELQKVAGWHLDTLIAHQNEWIGNPIVVHYPEAS